MLQVKRNLKTSDLHLLLKEDTVIEVIKKLM